MVAAERELLNFLLQDVPESFALVIFCFVLLNLRLRWKKVVPIAVLLSLTDVIEVLRLTSGVRSLIILIALIVYVKIFVNRDVSKIAVAAFFVALLDVLAGAVWTYLLLCITGMSYGQASSNPYLRALFSYPTILTILVATYVIFRYKKRKIIKVE